MATPNNKKDPPADNGCNDCIDQDNPTQKSITKERNKYCLELYESKGATSQQETKFTGESEVFTEKKCMFRNTEENYRRYRNLEITVGTEVLQTTESIKGIVDKLKKWNSDLNGQLKKLSKSMKDVKTKFGELKDAGCKLESSIKDKCNSGQWKALTGKTSENCKDGPSDPHPSCKDASKIIEDLICKPKGLILDIDSLFQSSADVVGIQVFSNIDTLEPLHKELDLYAKDFEKHIAETMKTRDGDLKKLQEELIKSVKEITKSAMDRNSLRSDFEGYYDAVYYMCCPPCECVPKDDDDDDNNNPDQRTHGHNNKDNDCYDGCKPRLKDCEEEICEICDDVKKAFCCDTTITKPPTGGGKNGDCTGS